MKRARPPTRSRMSGRFVRSWIFPKKWNNRVGQYSTRIDSLVESQISAVSIPRSTFPLQPFMPLSTPATPGWILENDTHLRGKLISKQRHYLWPRPQKKEKYLNDTLLHWQTGGWLFNQVQFGRFFSGPAIKSDWINGVSIAPHGDPNELLLSLSAADVLKN